MFLLKRQNELLVLAVRIYNEEPMTLYTDSVCLSQIIAPLETASYIPPTSRIQQQPCCLQYLLCCRHAPI